MNRPRKISFLATGNEIIEGETQDTNGNYFARHLHDLGASIYQHTQASDHLPEIVSALRYLLEHSDVVIMTGGMGPTSDDNSRFAVSEFTGKPLLFDETSWQSIVQRFEKFHLKLVPSNRQQALFPEGAIIYPNPYGSAPGCCVPFENKHIYMLPGPPKECRPMFETHIIPHLRAQSLFNKHEIFRWLTLGLSESEIGETIDNLAKPRGFDTGFRWHYPYLEIKVMTQNETPDLTVINEVDETLAPYCISRDRKNAFETLQATLIDCEKVIHVLNEMTESLNSEFIKDERLIYCDKDQSEHQAYVFKLTASPKIPSEHPHFDRITLSCEGLTQGKSNFAHQLTIPCRGPEVIIAAHAYAAWQLTQYIKSLK